MKRVLCIVSSLNTGGVETFLMKLYRTFNRDSYQINFAVNEAGIYDEKVKILGGKSISHVDQGTGKIYSVDEIKNNKQYEGLVCH